MARKNDYQMKESTAENNAVDFSDLLKGITPLKSGNLAQKNTAKPCPIPKFSPLKPTAPSKINEPKVDSVLAEYLASQRITQNNAATTDNAHRLLQSNQTDLTDAKSSKSEFALLFGPTLPIDSKNRVWIEGPKPKPNLISRTNPTLDPALPLPSDHIPWSGSTDEDQELVFLRPGLERNVLKKLRQGGWPVQAGLDFHGDSLDNARERFMCFMQKAEQMQLRCIRLVHGKGLGSRNGLAVIKPTLRAWLIQQHSVLAFCPASVDQGGTGAVLVLLRQPREKQGSSESR